MHLILCVYGCVDIKSQDHDDDTDFSLPLSVNRSRVLSGRKLRAMVVVTTDESPSNARSLFRDPGLRSGSCSPFLGPESS